MTTLRSFQAEIEQISLDKHKQAIKDAREAHAAAELARHHGKLPKAAAPALADVPMNGNGVEEELDVAKEATTEVSACFNDIVLSLI